MTKVIKTLDGISVGDVVALKTGGPDMTVSGFVPGEPLAGPIHDVQVYPGSTVEYEGFEAAHSEPKVSTVWFPSDHPGSALEQTFPVRALVVKTHHDDEKKPT